MITEDQDAVAIVGMAAVFPGASSLEDFWHNIVEGVDSISEVTAERWDPVYYDPQHPAMDRFYCRRGGFVDSQAVLDPVALGIVPSSVDGAEPDQLLSMALAARAVADAGGETIGRHRERTGVIVGRGGYLTPGLARLDQRVRTAEQLVTTLGSLLPHLDGDELAAVKSAFVERLGPDRPEAAIDLVPNLAASRVANRLDLHGPAYTVDAACASSLVAVDHAVHELLSGRCDVVIAGGVHLCQDVTIWSVFTQLGALSRTERIRPFDRRADGLLIGEGGGMVVLQRLSDAERTDARIYAVIRGTGVSSDGRSASLMRPSVEGQLLSLRRAWDAAGVDPSRIGLVEAHGTATPSGDATEVETLHRFFSGPRRDRPIVVGSVKSMIGHTMPAAGMAGLIKATLAVYHGVLPPTLHCEEPTDQLLAGGFVPLSHAEDWPLSGKPRTAGVNAFGFGGINGHVLLDQHGGETGSGNATALKVAITVSGGRAPADAGSTARGPTEAVAMLAAPDTDQLRATLDDVDPDAVGRPPLLDAPPDGPVRLALFHPTAERLDLARRVVGRGRAWRGRSDLWFSPRGLACDGGLLAFVFPGVEPTFEPRIADVARHFGLPMPELVDSEAAADDLEGLGRALIGVGRLMHTAVSELGLHPDLVAGQSIGEWSGMIATQMIPPAEVDAFIATIHPGSLEVPGVAFAALGCAVDAAERLFGDLEGLAISHDNCPHQTIVCGPDSAVGVLMERARAAKVLSQVLPFRSGFHTEMFTPFLEPIRDAYARLRLQPCAVPLWSATTCAPYPDAPDEIRALALAHLVERVRFRELTLALYETGVRLFVQVGVGSLPALLDDTLSGRDVFTIATNSPRRSGLDQLLRVAASCWVEGVEGIRFDRFSAPELPRPGQAREPDASRPGSGATDRLRTLPLGSPLIRLAPMADARGHATAERYASPTHDGNGPVLPPGAGAELSALLEEVTASGTAVANALIGVVDGGPADGRWPRGSLANSTRRRVLSIEEVPSLADHCFYRQAPDWPSVADRFPVVPMTALIEMMVDAAAELAPDMVATSVEQVRALRWLAVAPPVEVTIEVRELAAQGPRRHFRVTVEGYARADVVFSPSYDSPPRPAAAALTDGSPSPVSAARLYADRWMFHGPRYQGVRELGPIGRDGIDGELEVIEAPGALLDNAGQLMGFWVMLQHREDRLALPTAIDAITFYGPHPALGRRVGARVRFSQVDPESVRSAMELTVDGRLWARVEGWEDRRFETDETLWNQFVWPELSTMAEEQPGGWVMAEEHWRTSGSRELIMRRYLGEGERVQYAAHHPRAQRLHLLGRIAAKDAVRRWLWERGSGPLWPAQVEVVNDERGRPSVHIAGHPDLHVSIAHTPWVGVALVSEANVGIDVERIEPRSEHFVEAAFSDAELRELPVQDDDAARNEWLTRAWAAKEAVAKAEGTGLEGRPRRFVVEERQGENLLVNGWIVRTVCRGELVVAHTAADPTEHRSP